VMVPLVTDEEKKQRRQTIKERRRRRGKKAKPLPKAKPGADQEYKEFKIVAYYDETQDHRIVAGTKGDCVEAGVVMRRLATRIHLEEADEKIGNIDGSPWIRNQIERRELSLDAVGLDFYHLNQPRGANRDTTGRNEKDRGGRSQWRLALPHAGLIRVERESPERRDDDLDAGIWARGSFPPVALVVYSNNAAG